MARAPRRWARRARSSVVSRAVMWSSSSCAGAARCASASCAKPPDAERPSLRFGGEVERDRRGARDFALEIAAQRVGQRFHEFAGVVAWLHFELFQTDGQRLGRLHVQRHGLVALVVERELELRALWLLAAVQPKLAGRGRTQLALASAGRDEVRERRAFEPIDFELDPAIALGLLG